MIPRQDSDHPLDKIRFGLMVAIGGEDAGDTIQLLQEQETVARRELVEVPKRAEARGPEFLEHSQASRTELLKQLESYLGWILKAKEALEQQDSSEIMETYEASQDILPGLNSALDAYSRDFALFGPYKSGAANTLHRLWDAVAQGQAPKQSWTEYCRFFSNDFENKLDTVATVELPGRSFFRKNCETVLEELAELSEAKPNSGESIEEQLSSLDQAIRNTELFELEIVTANAGTTPIPTTNVMIDFLVGFSGGHVSLETLSTVVDDYADIMDGYAENFEQAASRPSDSALVQEEIPRTLDALDSHFAVIEELTEGLQDLNKDKSQEIVDKLKETAEQLNESREVFATAAQHQNHIVCLGCGRSNPPENRNCEACGETLPRPEDSGLVASSTFSVLAGPALEENQQLQMTENVARLFQSCDDVADGKITHAEFLAELQSAALGLKEFVDDLDSVAAMALDEDNFTPEQWAVWKSQHLPYLEDVAITYSGGLKEAEEGLQSMEYYLTEQDEQYLIDGIRLVWQGLSAVNRGRLSMETYTKMLGDVLQEARDEGLLTEG